MKSQIGQLQTFQNLGRTLIFSIWGMFSNRGKGLYICMTCSYNSVQQDWGCHQRCRSTLATAPKPSSSRFQFPDHAADWDASHSESSLYVLKLRTDGLVESITIIAAHRNWYCSGVTNQKEPVGYEMSTQRCSTVYWNNQYLVLPRWNQKRRLRTIYAWPP